MEAASARAAARDRWVEYGDNLSRVDGTKFWQGTLIGALVKGDTLTSDETAWAMNEIMEGAATPAQIAGFGVALRIKYNA